MNDKSLELRSKSQLWAVGIWQPDRGPKKWSKIEQIESMTTTHQWGMVMELGSVSAAHSSVEREREAMAGIGKCFLVTGPPVSIAITVVIKIKNDFILINLKFDH